MTSKSKRKESFGFFPSSIYENLWSRPTKSVVESETENKNFKLNEKDEFANSQEILKTLKRSKQTKKNFMVLNRFFLLICALR